MSKQKRSEDRVTIHRSREGSHEVTVSRVVETTACEKLASAASESQAIGAFLDWIQNERDEPLSLCLVDKYDRFYQASVSINSLLAEYFEIDLNAVERERRALLSALQESHR